jgi:hypothetical protein
VAGAVILFEQLGAQNVARHQVGGELHAAEIELQRLAQRAHQQRLAEAGDPFEQAVAAREQPDQQLLHHIALSDDRGGDGALQPGELGRALFDPGGLHRSLICHLSQPFNCSAHT